MAGVVTKPHYSERHPPTSSHNHAREWQFVALSDPSTRPGLTGIGESHHSIPNGIATTHEITYVMQPLGESKPATISNFCAGKRPLTLTPPFPAINYDEAKTDSPRRHDLRPRTRWPGMMKIGLGEWAARGVSVNICGAATCIRSSLARSDAM
ncbi:MAG TPA: hypothetical protein VLV18_05790 [Terriglobales bacterium]|nr:hypothetical protein [Terriglobales bacterium]